MNAGGGDEYEEEESKEEETTRDVKDIWGGEPIGLNGNIRIYRYSKGQFFDKHCELFPPFLFSSSSYCMFGVTGGKRVGS